MTSILEKANKLLDEAAAAKDAQCGCRSYNCHVCYNMLEAEKFLETTKDYRQMAIALVELEDNLKRIKSSLTLGKEIDKKWCIDQISYLLYKLKMEEWT